jgi:hypothetical protein
LVDRHQSHKAHQSPDALLARSMALVSQMPRHPLSGRSFAECPRGWRTPSSGVSKNCLSPFGDCFAFACPLPDKAFKMPEKGATDQPHQVEVHFGLAPRLIIERRPRNRQQAALRLDRQRLVGALNHPAPHLPVQSLSASSKKSFATASSPILPLMVCKQTTAGRWDMQRPDRFLVDLGSLLRATLEDVGGTLKQRLLPLMDHRRLSGM